MIAGVGLGAIAKGATGVGLPLVGVPVLASFLGVEHAVVLMALPTVVTNGWLLWEHRGMRGHTRHLPLMLVLGMAGAVIGTVLLRVAAERWLAATLALLILAYLGVRLARPRAALPRRATRVLSPPVGLAGGVLQGLTGVSGPLIITYFHAFQLAHGAFVFSIAAVFQLYSVAQIATFVGVGLYTPTRVVESVVALVPVVALFPVGIRLARRLAPRHLDRAVLALLLIMAVKLGYDAVVG